MLWGKVRVELFHGLMVDMVELQERGCCGLESVKRTVELLYGLMVDMVEV